jgi:sugar phosphate isomerase/epimerase
MYFILERIKFMVPHYDISQIRIGTCIPGWYAEKWTPHLIDIGFETLSVNFHMEYHDINIEEQGPRIKALAGEKGVEITTLGYYCNALENEQHRQNLIRAIDAAHLYGAKIVSTFAGAYEGKPVEEALPQFGKVFRDLTKRAEDKGVRLAIENCPMGGTWERATCNIGINPRA